MIATNPLNDRAAALAEIRALCAKTSKEWINALVEYSQRSGLFTVKVADDLDTSIFVGALVDSLDRQGYDVTTSTAVIGNDPAAGCLVLLVSCLVRRKVGEDVPRIIV